jgi:hypothetical protein
MTLNYMRTVLIAVIVVVFGYGQLACACIAPASTSELSVQAPETIMEMSDPAHMAHSSNPAHDISQKTEKMDHQNHGDRGHDEESHDCTHCDDGQIASLNSDGIADAFVPEPSPKKSIKTAAVFSPPTRAFMAPTSLAGLRWLDPPQSTPVSLKIKLLN